MPTIERRLSSSFLPSSFTENAAFSLHRFLMRYGSICARQDAVCSTRQVAAAQMPSRQSAAGRAPSFPPLPFYEIGRRLNRHAYRMPMIAGGDTTMYARDIWRRRRPMPSLCRSPLCPSLAPPDCLHMPVSS